MTKKRIARGFEIPKKLENNELFGAQNKFESATLSLQNDKPVELTFECLHNEVADLLAPQFAQQLCEKLDNLIDSHTRFIFDQFKNNDLEEMHFLHQVNDCWKAYTRQLLMIKGVFGYLDRRYVLRIKEDEKDNDKGEKGERDDKDILSIWNLGRDKFCHYFTTVHQSIQTRTVNGILNLIQQERQGTTIDRALVKDLLKMMSCLLIYNKFELEFFCETERLYKAESHRRVNDQDLPEYLNYINRIIKEETERSMYYLEPTTQGPLINIIEQQLIAVHMDFMLTKGLDQLLDDMKLEDLILSHSLLGRVAEGHQELCTHFNKHIKKRGAVIVTNMDRDKTMVQDLLDFKERMDQVVDDCFMRQEKFVYTLKEAFEHFINQRPNKPAELIAKFIDNKLRNGNKTLNEDELEKILDQILVLFRFIHGKDVFEAFYKKDLAKRLLIGTSASDDAERSMLSKLKQECGAAFTGKLEGMFKDVELSKDLMNTYRKWLLSHPIQVSKDIDIHVSVLTMGYWPTYQPFTVKMPAAMTKYRASFEKFYISKHNGRKLTWQPNLDQCHLSTVVQGKKRELIVSLFQALVLLMFNEETEIAYEDMLSHTSIEPVELKRTLQSLACGKAQYRVLTKEPKGKDIEDGDKFMINMNFSPQYYKIKINQVQLKETQEEQSMTEERVFQDRQYQIDAAIVRIMKTRKKLSHASLVHEVFEHLKFPVRAQDVKIRIESLIDRDYLNRDTDNSTQYNYVA